MINVTAVIEEMCDAIYRLVPEITSVDATAVFHVGYTEFVFNARWYVWHGCERECIDGTVRVGKNGNVTFDKMPIYNADEFKREFGRTFRVTRQKHTVTLPRFEFVSSATEAQKAAGLPERQTEHAAGYDFVSPETVTIQPGQMVMFDTGIKAYMEPGTMLLLAPRSSTGINGGVVLANGIFIIDPDFADSADNEGNIRAALYNRTDTEQTIHAGERYMQGVFVPFLTVPGETVSGTRRGGIGSTDRRDL